MSGLWGYFRGRHLGLLAFLVATVLAPRRVGVGWRKILLMWAGALTLALAAPAAQASTISLFSDPDSDGTFVDYVAAPGEANQFVVLGVQAGRLAVQDGFGDVSITPTDPCTSGQPGGSYEPRFASCPADTLVWIRADLGDGADYGSTGMAQFPVVLSGGAGPDTLSGGMTSTDDQLYGDEGNDVLFGGRGDDLLDGGSGADTLGGGDGIDAVDYSGRTAPVTATLDGSANDGEAGEGDRIQADVEAVAGGSADDTLIGNDAANGLFGLDGRDTITGGGAADIIDAGAGDDTIAARDGVADQVDCGAGTDTVTADAADSVTGCENVLLPSPASPVSTPAPNVSPPAPDVSPPRLSMPLRDSYRLQSVLRSGLLVPVTCSEACNVKVELFISASAARRLGLRVAHRLVLVGRASKRVPAPGTVRVRVTLTPKARRAMRSVRKIRLTVRATATDLARNTRVVKRTVTLKRRLY